MVVGVSSFASSLGRGAWEEFRVAPLLRFDLCFNVAGILGHPVREIAHLQPRVSGEVAR